MQLELGKIYEGKVTGITKFGAFVELESGTTGMVHISEVANTFVNEIKDHIQEGQTVKVKVLSIGDDGKISLSIKKAQDAPPRAPRPFNRDNNGGGGGHSSTGGSSGGHSTFNGGGGNRSGGSSGYSSGGNSGGGSTGGGARRPYENRRTYERKPASAPTESTFEDMLSKFKQNSEEKMSDLKKIIDNKRKSGTRRSGPKT